MPISFFFNPEEIVGKSYLMNSKEDGFRHHTRVVKAIYDFQSDEERMKAFTKFKCSMNNDQYEEILTYSELMDRLELQDNEVISMKKS
jgi:hypothetical protein